MSLPLFLGRYLRFCATLIFVVWFSSTLCGQNKVSTKTGNWNDPTAWSPNGVPTAASNVTVQNGHQINLISASTCSNLTIGTGSSGILHFNAVSAVTLTVNGNVQVNSGASISVRTAVGIQFLMSIGGSLVNNGIMDLRRNSNSICNLRFFGTGTQSFSGSGTITRLNTLTLAMGSATNILDVSCANLALQSGFLVLNSGTFRLATSYALAVTPFTGNTTIAAAAGLWMNSSTSTISLEGNVLLPGSLAVSAGLLQAGDASDESISCQGGSITVSGGTLSVAGRVDASSGSCDVDISGGVFVLNRFGSTSTSVHPFHLSFSGSSLSQSGGIIIIELSGGGTQSLGYLNSGTGTVTGGTVQLAQTGSALSQTMQVQSLPELPTLVVGSSATRVQLTGTAVSVLNNVVITGTLVSCPTFDVQGDFTSTGAFIGGTGTVVLNGGDQSYTGTSNDIFNVLKLSDNGEKNFLTSVTMLGNFIVDPGVTAAFDTNPVQLALRGSLVNNGSVSAGTGTVLFNGTTGQTIDGTAVTSFSNLTVNSALGVTLLQNADLYGTLSLTNGTLQVNGKIFTLKSGASSTARIGSITGTGNITGNVTIERFIPGGTTGWAFMGIPLASAQAFIDWDDDIGITCATCPDGTAGGFTSIFAYDESPPGLFDATASYLPITSINDQIEHGLGYWVYTGNGLPGTTDIMIDIVGDPAKFSYQIPLAYTNNGSAANDGWNLIANPYPSPVSWNSLRSGVAGLDNAIYVYNADLNGGTGGYATFVNGISSPAVGSGGVSDNIAMGQAFYVHVTAPATITAQESHKVLAEPTYLKTAEKEMLRLMLQHGSFTDEAVIYPHYDAGEKYDNALDAIKLKAPGAPKPVISITKSGIDCQVASMPVSTSYTADVCVTPSSTGEYSISCSGISRFAKGWCVSLRDHTNGTETDLRNNSYTGFADSGAVQHFTLRVFRTDLVIRSAVVQPVERDPWSGSVSAVVSPHGMYNFEWLAGSEVLRSGSGSSDSLSNLGPGDVTLKVSSVEGCEYQSADFNLSISAGGNTVDESSRVGTSGRTDIHLQAGDYSGIQVSQSGDPAIRRTLLIDLTGRIVRDFGDLSGGSQIILGDCAPGIYFITSRGPEEFTSRRVLIH
jgi:hypothetical protein